MSFIELSGQSFLWIRDLTKPDTILYIKAFEGLIILPASINLLPIIMTVLSIIQTAISLAKVQTEQTITMWLIPIIFMFIFWNLPSALVLYWTVQNLLSLIEQYIINKTLKY
jgi:YidC/Oxa1 family membrane protein insertase